MVEEQRAPAQAGELVRQRVAALVDLRAPGAFAQQHAQGAVSLPFSARGLAQRLLVALEPETPVVLLAPDAAVAAAAVAQLQDSPFRVHGTLDGDRWRDAGLPTESLGELSALALATVTGRHDLTVIDVREPLEWETGHVPGALLIALGSLRQRLPAIPRGVAVAVICESGVRNCTAASILQAAEFAPVSNVPDGTAGYRRAGLPLEFPAAPSRPDPGSA